MVMAELRKEWEIRIAAFRESGLSVPKWCATHNLKEHQLRYWLRKTAKAKSHNKVCYPKWLSVQLGDTSDQGDSDNLLVIRLGQITIEVKPGFDPVLLTQVVRVLREQC